MSLRVDNTRGGCVEMKNKMDGEDFRLGNNARDTTKDTSPYVGPVVPLVLQDLQSQVRKVLDEGEESGKRISGMQLSMDANRNAITRISKHELSSAGTPMPPSPHSRQQCDRGPWEKTLIFGGSPK